MQIDSLVNACTKSRKQWSCRGTQRRQSSGEVTVGTPPTCGPIAIKAAVGHVRFALWVKIISKHLMLITLRTYKKQQITAQRNIFLSLFSILCA